MLKRDIELVRDGKRQALLTWHKADGNGGVISIATEFADSLDAETRQRIVDICERPVNVREDGKITKAFSGSSKHFVNLPRVLARLGFRVRYF